MTTTKIDYAVVAVAEPECTAEEDYVRFLNENEELIKSLTEEVKWILRYLYERFQFKKHKTAFENEKLTKLKVPDAYDRRMWAMLRRFANEIYDEKKSEWFTFDEIEQIAVVEIDFKYGTNDNTITVYVTMVPKRKCNGCC